MTKAKNFTKY